MTVDSVLTSHGSETIPLQNVGNIVELVIGIPCAVIGPIVLGPAISNWVRSQREVDDLSKSGSTSVAPSAMILRSPTLRF